MLTRSRSIRLVHAGVAQSCALAACGLLIWQLIDFLYADIGGPATVLTAVVFGFVAWWALVGGDAVSETAAR